MAERADNIVVVGAGMVGAAAALGLAQAGLAVTVLESQPPASFIPGSDPDLRISAISMASVRLLERLGVWASVCAMRAVPYRGLETWEWQDARVAFRAESLGLPCLGYMLENRGCSGRYGRRWRRTSALRCGPVRPCASCDARARGGSCSWRMVRPCVPGW
ncbi:2-octaprenyl-3-methyl-6-methoxy-1,4-benzoquinol hydroxylase [Edwardsiella tarda]|nr:2-octaprenyl-3-methyl-6-methoxy-1,4-benzoquinol hydroxylase [Edwardsiella tarda]